MSSTSRIQPDKRVCKGNPRIREAACDAKTNFFFMQNSCNLWLVDIRNLLSTNDPEVNHKSNKGAFQTLFVSLGPFGKAEWLKFVGPADVSLQPQGSNRKINQASKQDFGVYLEMKSGLFRSLSTRLSGLRMGWSLGGN